MSQRPTEVKGNHFSFSPGILPSEILVRSAAARRSQKTDGQKLPLCGIIFTKVSDESAQASAPPLPGFQGHSWRRLCKSLLRSVKALWGERDILFFATISALFEPARSTNAASPV
jgi:hypothetical protein